MASTTPAAPAAQELPPLTPLAGLTDQKTLSLLHSLHTRSLQQEVALKANPPAELKDIRTIFAQDPTAAKGRIDKVMQDKFIALEADKCAFVHSLILSTGATRVVEVGTSFGVSTVYLSAAVGANAAARNKGKGKGKGKGVVIATEKEEEKCKVARENWHACGAEIEDRILLLQGDLEETLKPGGKVDEALKENEHENDDEDGGKIDFVLLDIWPYVALPALKLLLPRLRPGAVVLVDNTVAAADRYTELLAVLRDPKGPWQTITLPFSGGFDMSVYLGNPSHQ